MTLEGWIVLAILTLVLGALVRTRHAPDVVLLGGLTLAMVVPVPTPSGWRLGVIEPEQAFSGFSNTGMLTVGVLFAVVAGLTETGAVDFIVHRFLGTPKTLRGALTRMTVPVASLSAFLSNTPIVAMMVPAISSWSKEIKQQPSKFMLPLSYAAILGGNCSLIGSSTNLIINGLVVSEGLPSLGMFEVTVLGIPCALVGLGFVILAGPRLLPERGSASSYFANPREYTAEMMVEPDSPLVGKSVREAGLRNLPGAYLVEVVREQKSSYAVSPDELLEGGDRLLFVGVVESIRDLQRRPGLVPATNQIFKLDSPRYARRLFEAVISKSCPLAGRSIREGRFRNHYGAAVIGVARDSHRVEGRIGDIVLRPGDTLLLEARSSFITQYQNSRDFLLVTTLVDSTPRRQERAPTALLIAALMVTAAALGWLSMLEAALLASAGMVATRCCSLRDARNSVDWSVLVVIGAALGLGQAMSVTGLGAALANLALSYTGGSVLGALVVTYVTTWLLTELLTNNAAAALCFPIALELSTRLQVPLTPFALLLMVAGSSSFSTPMGYQTNLMVYGPGGYRFTDYSRLGVPLAILVGLTGVSVTYYFVL